MDLVKTAGASGGREAISRKWEGQGSAEERKGIQNKQEERSVRKHLGLYGTLSYHIKQGTERNYDREPGKRTNRRSGETFDVLSSRKDVSISKSIFVTE